MKKICFCGFAVVLVSVAILSWCGKNPLNNKQRVNLRVQESIKSEKLSPVVQRNLENQSDETHVTDQLSEKSKIDERVGRIIQLSRIVIPTKKKIDGLRELLSDKQLPTEIDRTLNDSSTYSRPNLTRKLRMLDAMYEGLKFPENQIRQRYFKLAEKIISERVPENYKGDTELSRQFVADRAEIALILFKVFPDDVERVRVKAKKNNPESARVFENAEKLRGIYEVAL